MQKYARHLVMAFVCGELLVLSAMCLYGKHGWYALGLVEQENRALVARIARAEWKVAVLKNNIELWQKDSFFAEQIAREQLHLARPNEVIVYY